MDDLLRSISWNAEKLFKQHGNRFPSVLFLAEYADGTRQRFERLCNNAPSTVNDADLLTELAKDVALDFAETNVVRFACAYLCKRTIVLRPVDPGATTKASTTKKRGICIELHGDKAPTGTFREILRSAGGNALLGAAEPLEGSFAESPYARVLELAAEARAALQAAAKATADAKAEVEAKAPAKAPVAAKPPLATRNAGQWPPQFLLAKPYKTATARAALVVAK